MLNFDALPKTFRPAKPFKTISTTEAEHFPLIIQRKRDGVRLFLVIGTTGAYVYSRHMENLSQHFPTITSRLAKAFLPGTIFDAEYVIETNGRDDFGQASAVCRSTALRGHALHERAHGHFYVFDVLYLAGTDAYTCPYRYRFAVLHQLVWPEGLSPMPELTCTFQEAQDLTRLYHWEGLILWNADSPTVIRFSGNTDTRANCYKWKPDLEDDFIATHFEYGAGSLAHVAGSFHLAQYQQGLLVPCGKVGAGLNLAIRKAATTWTYPLVVQVRYGERTADGKLRFPVFVRTRPDKTLEECECPSQ